MKISYLYAFNSKTRRIANRNIVLFLELKCNGVKGVRLALSAKNFTLSIRFTVQCTEIRIVGGKL